MLLQNFGENAELIGDVRAGMQENLKLAKSNIEFLKTGHVIAAPAATSSEEQVASAGSKGPPSSTPPSMPKRE